jgi:hypothetical protein
MYFLDPADGSLERSHDLHWLWWDAEEVARLFKYHGGPTEATYCNGRIYCAGLSFCIKQCIDPYQEADEDLTLWYNGNGDHVGDRFDQPEAGNKAWLCSGDSGAPWVYDYNGPDGRGISYFALPGEVAGWHYGQLICDNGGAFDGIYTDNRADTTWPSGLWYIAHDSIKGNLTSADVGVKENAPAAFTVSQNTPNPFNPSTTISFTLVKPGKVTVEVFNSAGQKVDTVVNGGMSAGSHTVTWNASKFAAGMYFYTVKSGEFSRTMKMTLLK